VNKKKHISETPATQYLRKLGVPFEEYVYDYVDHGGSNEAARQLSLDPHLVVKTLIMEDEQARPLIVLMHGDAEVSTKNLARQIDAKRITACAPDVAQRHSGYQVGGTSPFGTRKPMPVYVERTVLSCPRIFINGGRRGYLLALSGESLPTMLTLVAVDVALG